MAIVYLGNKSVITQVKKDDSLDASPDNLKTVRHEALGQRVTTMNLNETDIADRPNRAMNLALAVRLWDTQSDKPPSWVESDDELLATLIADHFGCPVGRPKSWREG